MTKDFPLPQFIHLGVLKSDSPSPLKGLRRNMTISANSTVYSSNVKEANVQETWEALQKQMECVLVDVRTEEEWQKVGKTDLSALEKNPVYKSWRMQPDMQINPKFLEEFVSQIEDRGTPLYFICKSGGRSAEAAEAVSQMGYGHCVNVVGGVTAWMQANLPWSNA